MASGKFKIQGGRLMARHINELNIESYKGFVDFGIKDLSQVNIILGDNNSGKTSLLEAIQILQMPYDFDNIVMVARQRDRYRANNTKFTQTQFSSFLNIFNKSCNDYNISLRCSMIESDISVSLTGEIKDYFLADEQIKEFKAIYKHNGKNSAIDEMSKAFVGSLVTEDTLAINSSSSADVFFDSYSTIMRSQKSEGVFPLEYISPMDHIVNDRFSEITKSKRIKEAVIKILQSSFDSAIQDIRTVEDEDGRTIRVIDHRDSGSMPLSTHGDGLKKAITLSNAVAKIKDGIILVDEFETSIHPNAMSQVFKFMLSTCKKRNIQLFLTTHSIEALDYMLGCDGAELGDIRVITLKKNNNKIYARIIDGIAAEKLRINNNAELR
jgi:AAA15 family ATPase/GTPase